jgi:hypothetical protein
MPRRALTLQRGKVSKARKTMALQHQQLRVNLSARNRSAELKRWKRENKNREEY